MSANLQAVRMASLDVLRDMIAPKANDDELRYLGAVAQRLGLDPIAGHIVLIGRWDSRLGREVHRPQVTADGRLVLAERTGQYHGYDGPEWCGPRNKTGGHDWVDVWDDDDPPHAARVIVHRAGWRPINGTVRWVEFAQRKRDGTLTGLWPTMPAHMLAKTALSLALRRGFPGIIPVDADLDDDLADMERQPPTLPPAPPADPAAPIGSGLRELLAERLARLDPDVFDRVTDAARGQVPNLRGTKFTVAHAETLAAIISVETAMADASPTRNRDSFDLDPDEPDRPRDAPAGPTPHQVHDDAPEAAAHEDGTERFDPEGP